jgi:hypothetical protein
MNIVMKLFNAGSIEAIPVYIYSRYSYNWFATTTTTTTKRIACLADYLLLA